MRKSPLRLCGKRFETQETALASSRAAAPGATAEECPDKRCGAWHVRQPKAPGKLGRKPRSRSTDPSPALRALVLGRDRHSCVRCGKGITGRPYSLHHRKRRSQGGRNAPGNLLTLCGSGTTGCHGWVHANIAESQASGWLLLSTQHPGAESVLYVSEHGSGMRVWLTESGTYSTAPPGVAA